MSSHAFIAGRYLKSRHSFNFISFISYLSIIGLGIGIAVLILTLAVLNGFENEIQNKIISFDGHIRLRGFLGNPLPEKNSVVDSTINSIPEILDRAPYIHNPAMIRYRENTEGVFVEGINRDKALSVFGTPRMIVSGEFAYTCNQQGREGVVLGQVLAENLGASVGDRVTLFDLEAIAEPGRPPRLAQFYIAGIFSTGLREYDDSVIYLSLKSAQKLFGLTGKISGEIIKTVDAKAASKVSQLLVNTLDYPYYSSTWKERHYNLFAWLNVQKYPITIIFALIALVVIINIVSSLTLIVMEKTRDIGVLRSIGYSRKDISKIFIIEGGLIGVIGVLAGFSLTLIIGYIQMKWGVLRISEEIYFMQVLPVLFNPVQFIWVGSVGIILALSATFYPAWKASNIEPAQALRYE